MAVPLTPDTSPRDLTGPAYVWSDEVGRVADEVLELHGRAGGVTRLHPIRSAVVDDELRIRYVLNRTPFDPAKEEVTHAVIAKCVKAPALWHDLYGDDVVIWVREYFWELFGDREQAGVVLHELLHVEVERAKDGTLKVRLRKHDVEEFTDVVRRYGDIGGGRAAFARAYAAYEHDGGSRIALQELANASGTSITIEGGGERATIEPEGLDD